MVQTFGTNTNNDIFIADDGNLSVKSGLQAVLEACQTATKAQLGEMVLTDKLGMPNFQTIWIGAPNFPLYESYLRNTLLSVPGVLDIKSLALSAAGNVLSYAATIVTQFGTTELNNG